MTMTNRAPLSGSVRAALYVPAHSMALFDAGIAAGPDAIIIDLEDGTPPAERELARLGVPHLVGRCRRAGVLPVVRVNGADTDDVERDLETVREAEPDVVLLPKADPDALRRVHALLVATGAVGGIEVWALVETVRSLLAIDDVVRSAPVSAVVLGYGDLCKELALPLGTDHPEFVGARRLVLDAAAGAGIAALDGVVLARDPATVEAGCRASFAAGFRGRTLYHPTHVAACRAAAPLDH